MTISIKVLADDFFQGDNTQSQNTVDNQFNPQNNSSDDSQQVTAIKRIAPNAFLLLKFGKNKYSVNGETGEFDFTPEMANKLIEEFQERAKDLVMDYDHSTIKDDATNTGNAPAAAWIGGLEITPDGLQAKVRNWTDKARGMVEKGEYRYHSPVLIFNEETKTPTGIQSIALTNHPALHGIPALVAASDTSGVVIKNPQSPIDADAKNKIQHFIVACKAALDSMNDNLSDALRCYSDLVKGNDDEIKQMKAFNDSLYIQPLADDSNPNAAVVPILPIPVPSDIQPAPVPVVPSRNMQAMIQEKENSIANGDDFIAWLDEEMGKTQDDKEKQILADKKNQLIAFKAQYPDLWAKGITNANPATIEYFKNQLNSSIPMSDFNNRVNGKSATEILDNIKTLSDMASKTFAFLKVNEVKSFDDLTQKIAKERKQFSDSIAKLEDKIKTDEINKVIETALNDGRLNESSKKTAITLAKKDLKAFNDFIAELPAKPKSIHELTQSMVSMDNIHDNNKLTKAYAFSDDEKKMMANFGRTEQEMIELIKEQRNLKLAL